jgi:hypothetical protein
MRYIFVKSIRHNKTKTNDMTFTITNQQENRVSRTTRQTIKHFLYSNNEVSISGMDGKHSVWHKQGSRMSQKVDNLNIVDAVKFANNLINSI